jgi:Tol biopolymer transport system component
MKKALLISVMIFLLIDFSLCHAGKDLIRTFVNGHTYANSEQEVRDLHIEYTRDINRLNLLTSGFSATATVNQNNPRQVDIVFDRPLSSGQSVSIDVGTESNNLDIRQWWWTDGTKDDRGNYNRVKKTIRIGRRTLEINEYRGNMRGDEAASPYRYLHNHRNFKPFHIYNKGHHWGGNDRFNEEITIDIDIRRFLNDADDDIDKDALTENIRKAIKQWCDCTSRTRHNSVPRANQRRPGSDDENDTIPANHGADNHPDPNVMDDGPSHNGGKEVKFRSVTDLECDAILLKYPRGLRINLITSDDDEPDGDVEMDMRWGNYGSSSNLGAAPTGARRDDQSRTSRGRIYINPRKAWHFGEDEDEDGYITNADDDDIPRNHYDFYSIFKHELGHALCFNHSGDDSRSDIARYRFEDPVILPFPFNFKGPDFAPFPEYLWDTEVLELGPIYLAADREGGMGGLDIWKVEYAEGEWYLVNLESINSPFDDISPSISADGTMLLFSSNRMESSNMGGFDIYASQFNFDWDFWDEPYNMGEMINSSANDTYPRLRGDMRTLYFSSDREEGYGQMDLYTSEYIEGKGFYKAQNMGDIINTEFNEEDPAISSNANLMIFSSDRKGGYGWSDLWYSNYDEGWQKPENMGENINTSMDETQPALRLDNEYLYFSSNRADKDFNIFTSQIQYIPPPDIVILDGGPEEIRLDPNETNPYFLFANNTSQDVYGLLIGIHSNKNEAIKPLIGGIYIENTTTGKELQWMTIPENLIDLPSNNIYAFGEGSDDYIGMEHVLSMQLNIFSELELEDEILVVAPVNSSGKIILPVEEGLQKNNYYSFYDGFDMFDAGKTANFKGFVDIDLMIVGLKFKTDSDDIKVLEAWSGNSVFNQKEQYLAFDKIYGAGDPLDYSFMLNQLNDVALTEEVPYTLITVKADVEVGVKSNGLSSKIALAAYPNPFEESIEIIYDLPDASYVDLELWSMLGEKILDLKSGFEDRGEYHFNMSVNDDLKLSNGIYIVKLSIESNGKFVTKTLPIVLNR